MNAKGGSGILVAERDPRLYGDDSGEFPASDKHNWRAKMLSCIAGEAIESRNRGELTAAASLYSLNALFTLRGFVILIRVL
jgi:hypothetical protein